MKSSFYIYNNNIFNSGKDFYLPGAKTIFGRVHNNQVEFCHEVRFNNRGFRDDFNYEDRRDKREIRIAAIGDSFTINLDCNNPWPKLLGSNLKERYGPNVKVYNLGLTGAGPVNWIDLKDAVKRIDPDIILLGMYDDIMTRPFIRFYTLPDKNRFYCVYGRSRPFTRPVGIFDPRFPDISADEYDRYALELEQENTVKRSPLFPYTSYINRYFWRLVSVTPGLNMITNFEKSAKILEQIITWAPSTVMASFPSLLKTRLDTGIPGTQENYLKTFSRKHGLRYLNFIDIFREKGYKTGEIYTISSSHWSDRGNQAVADVFTEELVENISKAK